MHRLDVKAHVDQTTELGYFSALAAAYSVDRTGERIVPGAFGVSIARWQQSRKSLPLHWDHRADAEAIIGEINPDAMVEIEDGLFVEGSLDILDSDLARSAWRSVKKNRIGLSFGYLVTDERVGADGVRELTELDVFEISLTATPANGDTRVLSTKSLGDIRVRRFEC